MQLSSFSSKDYLSYVGHDIDWLQLKWRAFAEYQAFATSSFMMHSSLSTIAVVQAIILAIAKPVSAKISDVFGRAEAFILSVIFYVVGYIGEL